MATKGDILTSYCFIAALIENQNDLYNHVYVPICKRALSLYNLRGGTKGHSSDIKQVILEEYGLDVPVIIVRKLIRAVFDNMSKKQREKANFKLFQDGDYFELDGLLFTELEDKYKEGRRNAKAIQLAFEEYLKSIAVPIKDLPSFSEFLDRHRRELAVFFKNIPEKINGTSSTFIYHVEFLEHIEVHSHELYKVAQSLYLGSIVASYIESGVDLEPKFDTKQTFFIDTSIILRLLDLQKEEETQPIRELIQLIRNTGGEVNTLSITIEEVNSVIEEAISNYHTTVPTTTINEACNRRRENLSWLILFNSKITEILNNEFGIHITKVPETLIEKINKSQDVRALQGERIKKGNALHDVVAYSYVRDHRGIAPNSFQKAKSWFLTTNRNLLYFNMELKPGKVSEIVLPDTLTSILWLKNPSKFSQSVKQIGLSELMASTLNEEIASKELINEFENNVKKLTGISEQDYKVLLESVAHQSAKKINEFIETAHDDTKKAQLEAQKMIDQERSRRNKLQAILKEAKDSERQASEENQKLKSETDALKLKLEEIEWEMNHFGKESAESKTVLERLAGEIEQGKEAVNHLRKIQYRIVFALVAFLVCAVIFAIAYHSGTYWVKLLRQCVYTVAGFGGFWSFVSMIINIKKYSEENK